MALADIRLSVIGIINEVQRRLGVDSTSTLTATKQTTVLLGLLNDVIDEVSDFGDWPQMFREVLVTAQSSVGTYKIAVSADVHNVYEMAWNNDVAPMEVLNIEDIRQLQRLTSHGVPRQFAMVGVSGTVPKFRCSPVPTTAATFDVAYYKKPAMFDTGATAAAAIPAFPARMLIQGLYAKSLLEEAGGEQTTQFQTAYSEYLQMRKEALNRFTVDTGTSILFVPE